MEERIDNITNQINEIFICEIKKYRKKFNRKGEIELFEDFIETYLRAYKMLKNNKLVDGIIIARSSFEVLTILIGIHINSKCKEEYFRANRYERYQQRKKEESKADDYTSQKYLRKIIKKRCKNVENDMDKMYKFLSLYAHPTIYRNALRNIEKEKINISKIYYNIIISMLIIAIIIFKDLNFIDEDTMFDLLNLKQWLEAIINKYEISKIAKLKFDKIEIFMYKDINHEFFEKDIKNQKKELISMQKEFNNKKTMIEQIYQKTANKIKYHDIYSECIEILKALK